MKRIGLNREAERGITRVGFYGLTDVCGDKFTVIFTEGIVEFFWVFCCILSLFMFISLLYSQSLIELEGDFDKLE